VFENKTTKKQLIKTKAKKVNGKKIFFPKTVYFLVAVGMATVRIFLNKQENTPKGLFVFRNICRIEAAINDLCWRTFNNLT